MFFRFVLILACFTGVAAGAQDPTSTPEIAAATADALEAIKRQVLAENLSDGLNVDRLVTGLHQVGALDETIRTSEQLGGARSLGDQVIQVRLSLDASKVGKVLVEMVKSHPAESPISTDALQKTLKNWAGREFSATGTSLAASDVARLRPPDSTAAWSRVSDPDRQVALRSARNAAISNLIDNLKPVAMGGSASLGDVLSDREMYEDLFKWVASRPVQEVAFGDDLVVRLTLSTPPEELWGVVHEALLKRNRAKLPSSQAQWDALQKQVITRAALAVGSGSLPKKMAPDVALPQQSPLWVTQRLEAQASSNNEGQRLRTARRAEALALEKLRVQVESMPLGDGTTIGDAARKDPAIAKSLTKALSRARPFKVDYGDNGSATVHVSIRLSDVWGELKP